MTSSAPEGLDVSQRLAVEADAGPLIIAAGPGTGKTRVLVHRIAHMIRERGVEPKAILGVTFTRGAALELRERLGALLPGLGSLSRPQVGTFHAAALRLLREEGFPFGPGVGFSVVAEEQKPGLLEGLVSRREQAAFLEGLRRRKQGLQGPGPGAESEYQGRLEGARLLDFDDVLLLACRLLDERPGFREEWRRRVRHVLVDEFQDTSFAQYELLRRLAPDDLCVIGDPDQAIYGFTADGFAPFERFRQDHAACRILALSGNYRSQAAILEAAKQVIARSRSLLPRELQARLAAGLPIEISPHQSERQEAEITARRIEGLLGGSSHFAIDSRWAEAEPESGAYGLADIAILYRFHAQARAVEKVLDRAGLPYKTYGKKSGSGGEVSAAEELEDFRESEGGAPPMLGPRGDRISLMTLHRAKGLEFPAVFILGCSDGVLPWRAPSAWGRREDPDEERRLFYVGMTRAKRRLFLSYARKRMLFGRAQSSGPSPFLADIEEELRLLRESRGPVRKPAKASQPSLF